MSMTREERRERIAKLKAAVAAWLADEDALNDEYAAAEAMGLLAPPDGDARTRALVMRDDAICEEAMAVGAMGADFMQEFNRRGTWHGVGLGKAVDRHNAWLRWRAANPEL